MKPTLCTGSGYQMLLLLLACTYANGIRSVLQVNRFTNIYVCGLQSQVGRAQRDESYRKIPSVSRLRSCMRVLCARDALEHQGERGNNVGVVK